MKAIISLLVLGLAVPFNAAIGQDEPSTSQNVLTSPGRAGPRGGGLGGFGRGGGLDADFAQFANAELPRFDLDFPGGTPGALVEAIQKSSGRPLNVIIPSEFRNTDLPALKMKAVTVPELFQALQMASLRTEPMITGTRTDPTGNRINTVTYQNTGYGFRAPPLTDLEHPIWYFYVARPGEAKLVEPPPKVCRFYWLGAYLEKYSIDDITTAIQTGWKMLGDPAPPTMNFHKDTRLLIAVGEADKLRVIDSVLAELRGTSKSDTNVPASNSAGR